MKPEHREYIDQVKEHFPNHIETHPHQSNEVWMAGALATLGEWAENLILLQDHAAVDKACELIGGMETWLERFTEERKTDGDQASDD